MQYIFSNKQKFIAQIKNNSIDQRKIDEGAFDQEGGMNFGEYVALLSGNTDLLEKVKLEKRLYDLERSYQSFMKRKSEFQIGITIRDIDVKERSLSRIDMDWKSIASADLEKLPIVIKNIPIEDKKIAGEQLLSIIHNVNKEGISIRDSVIAKFSGFNLVYDPGLMKVYVSGTSGQLYNYADGKLNENLALAGRYIIDSFKRIPKIIENTKESIQNSLNRIEVYAKERTTEFKDKPLIKNIRNMIDELNTRIENATAQKAEAPEVKSKKMPYDNDHSNQQRKKGARI